MRACKLFVKLYCGDERSHAMHVYRVCDNHDVDHTLPTHVHHVTFVHGAWLPCKRSSMIDDQCVRVMIGHASVRDRLDRTGIYNRTYRPD